MLLHIAASPRSAGSQSRRAARTALGYWRACHPGLQVLERDIAANPVPHPDATFVQASLTPSSNRDKEQHGALAGSEELIGELDRADAVLISTPMHNFAVPSSLKAWLDHVVRPGRTFSAGPAGKKGLLRDRPVRVIMTCGGVLGHVEGGQQDWATPYLRYLFASIGLRDFDVCILEGCNRGAEALTLAEHTLQEWLVKRTMPIRPAS